MHSAARGTSVEDVAPGSIVWVRDEEWLVTQVGRNADGILVTCQGLSELVQGTTAQFSQALDTIEVSDPRLTRVVPDASPGYRQARLWLEAALRKTPLPVDDPTLAVVDGVLADPLDYQRTAVRKALDPQILRPRILLADTVGLGKTLEIGMILSELVRRGRGERILIVTPRHVLEQMQHEMWSRFALPFVRLDSVGIQRVRRQLPATRNPFSLYKRAIISIDTLKSERYLNYLARQRWDAVVIDESHNITNSATKNNALARTLAPMTDALILASATPHNGKKESFAELVRLLEPTAVTPDGEIDPGDLQRLVIRRHRHSPEVAQIVGTEWAERHEPEHRLIPASPEEDVIAQELADHWLYGEKARRASETLFGWTLAKAFLSSPAALAETAANRLRQERMDPDDRASLERLRDLAEAAMVTRTGKYAGLLAELERIGIGPRSPERVVVFAERVATLGWLRDKVIRDVGLKPEQVEILHGGLSDVEQQAVVESFKQAASPVRVLITGDVASEGVNLHLQCHELIHFDIPWSLIRIEQRNGRIDRYGQRHRPRITTLLLTPGDERFRGDLRVLTALMDKEHEAHTALGDSASLMGQHSVEAEEKEILKVLQHRQSLDDAVRSPEQVMAGSGLDALIAQLAMAAAQPREVAVASGAAGVRSASGLFDSPTDYLREAVSTVFARPEQEPGPRGSGGVGWVEHPSDQIVELTPPSDLRARLSVLPQSYLAEREVTRRLRLATTPAKGKALLAEALRDDRTTWPAAHYLGPLHPVLDWVSDRVMSRLGRGEVFAVRGDGDSASVLLLGVLTNKMGQTVSASWIQIEFPDPAGGFAMAQAHDSAAAMCAAVGLSGRMSNPGPVADVGALQRLVPVAVDRAEQLLASLSSEAERVAVERAEAWAHRATRWEHEADALVQRGQVRQRRVSVEQEHALADARRPDRRYVRPLLVVLPADHPVGEATQDQTQTVEPEGA